MRSDTSPAQHVAVTCRGYCGAHGLWCACHGCLFLVGLFVWSDGWLWECTLRAHHHNHTADPGPVQPPVNGLQPCPLTNQAGKGLHHQARAQHNEQVCLRQVGCALAVEPGRQHLAKEHNVRLHQAPARRGQARDAMPRQLGQVIPIRAHAARLSQLLVQRSKLRRHDRKEQ